VYGSAAREQLAREVHHAARTNLEGHVAPSWCVSVMTVSSRNRSDALVCAIPAPHAVAKKIDAVGDWHPEVDKNCIRTLASRHGIPVSVESAVRTQPFQTDTCEKCPSPVVVHDEHVAPQQSALANSAIVSRRCRRQPLEPPPIPFLGLDCAILR